MPLNQQEIAHSYSTAKFLEEGVLAGVGVLLVFLGVFSRVPLTNILAVGIGAFVFYTALELYRWKARIIIEADTTNDDKKDSEDNFSELSLNSETKTTIHHQRSFESYGAEQRNRPTISAADFVEETPKYTMSNLEPQSEFNNLLVKVLSAIKDVCFAHTAAFFWVNHDSKQLIVEAKSTGSSSFIPERKIPLGADVVSRIAAKGAPEIVNSILAETEKDILCYYTSLQNVKSFIGVPVFYANDTTAKEPIGVIAVDSMAEDAYGEETFTVLSHFSKLISALLISYTEKYELFADVRLIEADMQLKKKLSNKPTVSAIVNGLAEELENLIAWDSLSIVLFDENQGGWSLASVRARGNERFVSPKQLINLDASIVGKALQTNTVQQVNLVSNTQMVFHAQEGSSDLLKQGTLIVIPFSSNGKCFGAVVVTNRKTNQISKKDIVAVQFLASTAASALEIAELNTIVHEHIALDEQTGLLSKKYFAQRLQEELQRANDTGEDVSLAMLSLSNSAEIEQRYGVEGINAALISVANHLRSSVRVYDVVARFDPITFATILAGTTANDAYLWGEKLRTTIAGSIVTANRKSFSISVTIGISGAAAAMQPDDLLKNALLVLEQAKKAGGNIVRVF